jgi:hypothetical protein
VHRIGLILGALSVLVSWGAAATPAHAQACSPRPPVQVQQARDGTVTLTATTPITQVIFNASTQYAGSLDNVALDLPGQPPALPATLNGGYRTVNVSPAATTYTFHLYTLTPQPVTLPITVADGCGYVDTLVGSGSNMLPTHVPTQTATPTRTPLPTNVATSTRTPTPPPTATMPVIPTATPVTQATVVYGPAKVYQGAKQTWSWYGRTAPQATDFLVLAKPDGTFAGPPVYTSSCTSTPGSVAKGSGWCEIAFTTSLAPGFYQLQYRASAGNVLLALEQNDQVLAQGAAIDGRGQEWGTSSLLDDVDVAVAGGYSGFQAYITVPDPSFQTQVSWYHIGLNSIGNYSGQFLEVGIRKACSLVTVPACIGNPYMSWTDSFGQLQGAVWDGSPSNGPYGYWPNIALPLHIQSENQFKVFETAATAWTGEMCDLFQKCCPLWLDGPVCRPIQGGDLRPVTYLTRYPQWFAGTETLSPGIAGGAAEFGYPQYFGKYNSIQWIVIDCWDHEWRMYDPSRVLAILTQCDPPYAGWGVQTAWR